MGKVAKDKRDIFYRKAKEEGWRARSAYKLLQIQEEFNIFNNVKNVVDLCAAPGSWSQVLSRELYLPAVKEGENEEKLPRIVSVDLQPMAPLEGIIQIQGDITSEKTVNEIIEKFYGNKADLVVCDGAPDVTGLHDMDEYIQSQLILAALVIVTQILNHGGTFVSKIFRGKDISLLYSQLKALFNDVICTKPRSSRNSSIEAFVVCKEFNPPMDMDMNSFKLLLSEKTENYYMQGASLTQRCLVPFLACGDLSGWDPDRNYDLEEGKEILDPVAPPTEPAYKLALETMKNINS